MKIYGNGSIIPLEKAKSKYKCRKWRLYVSTSTGQRTKHFNGTWTEAKTALIAFKIELADTPDISESFMAYAEQWLAYRMASGQFAPGTIANNKRELAAFSRSPLSMSTLTEITPQTCREALVWIKTHPASGRAELSNTTMNKIYITLNTILAQAVDDGLLSANPMAKIRAPKPDTKERRALSPDELMQFVDDLDKLPLDGRAMTLYFMALAGLRRSEACALYDSDVTDRIHVHRAVKERNGTIGEPKSAAGCRVIPSAPLLLAKVDEWRELRETSGRGHCVTLCCNSRGGVMRPQLLQRWWTESASPKLGYDITLHQLRHSNLSMMARYMSPFDLQRYAGWSSIEPAKVYVHADDSALDAAMSAAFSRKPAAKS